MLPVPSGSQRRPRRRSGSPPHSSPFATPLHEKPVQLPFPGGLHSSVLRDSGELMPGEPAAPCFRRGRLRAALNASARPSQVADKAVRLQTCPDHGRGVGQSPARHIPAVPAHHPRQAGAPRSIGRQVMSAAHTWLVRAIPRSSTDGDRPVFLAPGSWCGDAGRPPRAP